MVITECKVLDPIGASLQSVPTGRAGPSSTLGIVMCFVFYPPPKARLPWCPVCFIVSTLVSLGLCCLYLQLASDSLPTLGCRVPTEERSGLTRNGFSPLSTLVSVI